MSLVTISPKYQIVIPKDVRNGLHLRVGQQVEVLCFEDRIELVPIQPIQKLKGFLKGMSTRFKREADRL